MRSEHAKRTAVAGLMLIVLSVGGARADSYHLKDVLRPSGHERTLSEKRTDGRACGSDQNNQFKNVASFKKCMRVHGWVVDKYTPDPKPRNAARSQGTRDHSGYVNEDGLICHGAGGVDICDPPNGTVKYRNEEGLNCTRNGLVAICSNM